MILRLTFLFTLIFLQGCSSLGVKPWQKATLANQEMLLTAESLDLSFDDHIYFSKEASSGGQGSSGGGCGCN